MLPHNELEQLRARLDFLSSELAESRRVLAALEERSRQAGGSEAPPRVIDVAPVPPASPVSEAVDLVAASAAPPVREVAADHGTEPPPLPVFAVEPATSAPDAASAPMPSSTPTFGTFEPAGPSPLRVWLERLQLWPPQDDENAEVRLGAWWATRLGTLFAVIAAVFFGVYLSVGTPPWVKLVELTALSVGIAGVGWWLERRWPRFGQVLFAGGLALIFFTAMAAYTVPAVKVLDSRLAAVAWQLAAAALIATSAWRRRAPGEATMAVALGFVAAWFSLAGGLQLFAGGAALALAATAVIWRRWLGWSAPSIVALFGYWGITALLVAGFVFGATPLLPAWVWIFVLGGFGLFFWRDDPAGSPHPPTQAETVWFQNTNSSLAVAVGWFTAWAGFNERLGTFYVAATVVLGLAAWRRARIAVSDTVGAVLLAKASGALTLAVITWTDGRTTEMALLVQAAVMLAANVRVRSRVLAVASAAVWGLSLCYRADGLAAGSVPLVSIETLVGVAYAVGAVIWLLEAARAWRRERGAGEGAIVMGAAWIGAVLALATAYQIEPPLWLPARLVVAAGLLVVLARCWGRPAVAAAGGIVLVAGHLAFWFEMRAMDDTRVLLNLLAVLLPTLAACALLGRRADARAEDGERTAALSSWSVSALAVVTAAIGGWRLLEPGVVLLIGAALTAGLALAAPARPRRSWMWLAAWTLVVSGYGFLVSDLTGDVKVAAAVALFAWIGVAALQATPRMAAQLASESTRDGPQRTAVIVGLVFAICASASIDPRLESGLAAAGGFALLACLLLTWVWVGAFRGAAWTLWTGAMYGFFFAPTVAAPWIGVTVASAWVPVLLWGSRSSIVERWRNEGRPAEGLLQLQSWLATALAVAGIHATQAELGRVWWSLGGTLVLVLLARGTIPSLRNPARVMGAAAWAWAVLLWFSGATKQWGEPAYAGLAAAVAAAALPLALLWPAHVRAVGGWVAAGLGLLLAMAIAGAQRGELEPFITVLWGAAALLWFGMGLVWRSRPHRLLGLIGLLVCIPRVFLVDLQSTLHRIMAFAALGVVLLWVGFSYHRFRHWITDDPAGTPDEGKG